MSSSPDSGPKANRYVCVPSPMDAKPSPPEICWHLIAPFTFVAGIRYPLAPVVNVVGPEYAGSELLLAAFGWVMVWSGHCTWNDCAAAGSAATQNSTDKMNVVLNALFLICPPSSFIAAVGGNSVVLAAAGFARSRSCRIDLAKG